MSKLSEQEILERDAGRDLEAELREALEQLKRGEVGRILTQTGDGRFMESPLAAVRFKTGLSQAAFAGLLGVSVPTLQQWEQGEGEPTGAASTVIAIAGRHPEVVRELAA
jgi:putative transcriptional regulator